jgi:hypothetical protein
MAHINVRNYHCKPTTTIATTSFKYIRNYKMDNFFH